MTDILTTLGHTVELVENGLEAVSAVMRSNYDIVLMDVQMPVMDGLEATRRIRSLETESAAIPIIGITANVMQSDIDECFAAGMNGFVAKPIKLDDLITALIEVTETGRASMPLKCDDVNPIKLGESKNSSNLDLTIISELEDMVGSSKMPNIIAIQVSEYERSQPELQAAVTEGDLDSVRRLAHALKSAFGNFGATRAQELALGIESAAKDGDPRTASKLFNEFQEVAAESLVELQSLYTEESASAEAG